MRHWCAAREAHALTAALGREVVVGGTVCCCSFTPGSPRVHRAWFQRLKRECDELLSNSAFKFKVRRYSTEVFSPDEFVSQLARLNGGASHSGSGSGSLPSHLNRTVRSYSSVPVYIVVYRLYCQSNDQAPCSNVNTHCTCTHSPHMSPSEQTVSLS